MVVRQNQPSKQGAKKSPAPADQKAGKDDTVPNTGEPNLTIALFDATGAQLTWKGIHSIDTSVGDSCWETSACPHSIKGPGQGKISYPLAVPTGRTLRIEQTINYNDESTAMADPILINVDCDQSATVNSIVRAAAACNAGFTDVMVQGYWCGGEEGERELRFAEATATMAIDAANSKAGALKASQPVRATVRDDVAIFQLKSGATYRIAAKIAGEEAAACSDTGTITVPVQGESPILKIGFTRLERTVVLVFVDSAGQLASPCDVFEENLGRIEIGSNGIATVYPKDSRTLRLISSGAELHPNTIHLNERFTARENEAEAYIVRLTASAASRSNIELLEEEFFLLDGLLAGALVEVLDMEGALIATLTADSSGRCQYPVAEPGQAYDFVHKVKGKELERVRLRSPIRAELPAGA